MAWRWKWKEGGEGVVEVSVFFISEIRGYSVLFVLGEKVTYSHFVLLAGGGMRGRKGEVEGQTQGLWVFCKNTWCASSPP